MTEKEGKIVLIAAVAENGVIGLDGDIPWAPYEGDLRRFQRLTKNHGVLMGRRTAEELQRKGVFPLKYRKNIVLTSQENYGDWGDVIRANDLQYAIDLGQIYTPNKTVYIIGGEMVFRETISLADRLEITEIPERPRGDTYFPGIDNMVWREISREKQNAGHSFVTYERKK